MIEEERIFKMKISEEYWDSLKDEYEWDEVDHLNDRTYIPFTIDDILERERRFDGDNLSLICPFMLSDQWKEMKSFLQKNQDCKLLITYED